MLISIKRNHHFRIVADTTVAEFSKPGVNTSSSSGAVTYLSHAFIVDLGTAVYALPISPLMSYHKARQGTSLYQ